MLYRTEVLSINICYLPLMFNSWFTWRPIGSWNKGRQGKHGAPPFFWKMLKYWNMLNLLWIIFVILVKYEKVPIKVRKSFNLFMEIVIVINRNLLRGTKPMWWDGCLNNTAASSLKTEWSQRKTGFADTIVFFIYLMNMEKVREVWCWL